MSKLFPVESDVPKTLEQERVTQIVKAWMKAGEVPYSMGKKLQAAYKVEGDFLFISLTPPAMTLLYSLKVPAKFLDQEHSLEDIRSYFIQEEIRTLKEKRAGFAESMRKTEARISSLVKGLSGEKDENNLPI